MPNLLNSRNRVASDFIFDDGANGSLTSTSYVSAKVSTVAKVLDLGNLKLPMHLNIIVTASQSSGGIEVYTLKIESNVVSAFTTESQIEEIDLPRGVLGLHTIKFTNKYQYVRVMTKGANTPVWTMGKVWASPVN